jgi:magnesium chelatase accessory protein
MSRRLDWEVDGARWPHREASRFVEAGGLRWHVQVFGGLDPARPVALLLHGTGASTHSWRDVAPALARGFTVVAPDLPGHGFSGDASFSQLSLPGMARALAALLKALSVAPALGVGHSAGAALLLRMALDGLLAPRLIVSVNGALQPFAGLAGQVFAPIARMLALWPAVPSLFAWRASDPNVVGDLLKRTGSRIDADGAAIYGLLARNPAHVGAALGMMANWDLPGLKRDLGRVVTPVLHVVGAMDAMVPPEDAVTSQREIRSSRHLRLKGLGHLAHEEAPELVVRLIEDVFEARDLSLAPAEGREIIAAGQTVAGRRSAASGFATRQRDNPS